MRLKNFSDNVTVVWLDSFLLIDFDVACDCHYYNMKYFINVYVFVRSSWPMSVQVLLASGGNIDLIIVDI